MTAVRIEGLTKRFGEVEAVAGLDLTVESGEVFGFLGPNGAGKSTTINVLLGFIEPTSGSATVFGHDVVTESKAVRRQIGILPEGASVYERLTGEEHLESAVRFKDATDDPQDVLETVGIAPEDAIRPAGEYSKGMCQRLALGMALVGDPDLLILDEPASGLDPTGIKEVRSIVREQVADGTTVFFSSHQLAEVEAVCSRVGIMKEGQLAAVGSVDGLRNRLGSSERLSVTVGSVPPSSVLEQVSQLEGVTDVTVESRTLLISCTTPRAKIDAFRYVDESATIQDFSTAEASLEELFGSVAGDDTNAVPAEGTTDPKVHGGVS